MRTAFYYASAVLLGLAFGIVGVLYLERVWIPPMPVEIEQVAPQPPPLPPSLDDLQVTVIRVGSGHNAPVRLAPHTAPDTLPYLGRGRRQ